MTSKNSIVENSNKYEEEDEVEINSDRGSKIIGINEDDLMEFD